MKTTLILCCIVASIATHSVFAEQPPQESELLSNTSIIELKELGLGEGVIVEKIRSSSCNFDVSISGLKQLKAAGISDAVIAAMLSAKPATSGAAPAAAAQPTDPNDPMSPHDPGIWFYEEIGGKPKMTVLEPSVYSQGRSGSMMFVGFGATVKQEAVIRSARASMSTSNRQPVFYFYFERTQAGLSDSHGATSPNEYILAQFEVKEGKDNQRRLVIGSINAYAGGQSGTDSRSLRDFDFQKLAPGIYKVVPKENLANGEYGFFYGGNSAGGYGIFAANSTGGKVFDFGVRGTADSDARVETPEKTEPTTKKKPFVSVFQKKKNEPAGTEESN